MSELEDFEKWLDGQESVQAYEILNWNEYRDKEQLRNQRIPEEVVYQKLLELVTKKPNEKENSLVNFNAGSEPVSLLDRGHRFPFILG